MLSKKVYLWDGLNRGGSEVASASRVANVAMRRAANYRVCVALRHATIASDASKASKTNGHAHLMFYHNNKLTFL